MKVRTFRGVALLFAAGSIFLSRTALAEDWAVFDTQEKDGSFSTKAVNLSGATRVLSKGNVTGIAGRRVVVCRHRADPEVIRFVRPTGEEVRPAVPSVWTVSISPDGNSALLQDGKELTLVSLNGGAPRKLHEVTEKGSIESLSWSPDEKRLAYTVRQSKDPTKANSGWIRNSYVIPAAGGKANLLIKGGAQVAWSPDGARLAYMNRPNIFVADGDGKNPAQVHEGNSPAWAGKYVIFKNYNRKERAQIILRADASGKNAKVLNEKPGTYGDFSISPDGKTVAAVGYLRDSKEKSPEGYRLQHVLLINIASGRNTILKNTVGNPVGETYWSPDGRMLLLRINEKGVYKLLALPVDGSPGKVLAIGANQVAGWARGPAPIQVGAIVEVAAEKADVYADQKVVASPARGRKLRVTAVQGAWLGVTWQDAQGKALTGWIRKASVKQ